MGRRTTDTAHLWEGDVGREPRPWVALASRNWKPEKQQLCLDAASLKRGVC